MYANASVEIKRSFYAFLLVLPFMYWRPCPVCAQHSHTEYWFSFGHNYRPIPSDTVVYGSTSRYEVHIASLHHAKGIICFNSIGDTVRFSVRPGHVFSHHLTRAQILACYHQVPRDLGKVTGMSVGVTADSAISVSVISQQLHSSDAVQLLPVEAWGTDYRMIRQVCAGAGHGGQYRYQPDGRHFAHRHQQCRET